MTVGINFTRDDGIPSIASKDRLSFTEIPRKAQRIRILSAGDMAAPYERTGSEPSHTGKARSRDRWLPDGTEDTTNGGWWQVAEREIDARIFGLTPGLAEDGDDNLTAINSAIAWSAATRGIVRITEGSYKIGEGGNSGIIVTTNARVVCDPGAKLYFNLDMSSNGSRGAFHMEDTLVPAFDFSWTGGQCLAHDDGWDGNVFWLFGDRISFTHMRIDGWGATSGRIYGGGGTWKFDVSGVSITASDNTLTFPAGFLLRSDDRGGRVVVDGAGAAGAELRGWIGDIAYDAGTETYSCEVLDADGSVLNASTTVADGDCWIDRIGEGITFRHIVAKADPDGGHGQGGYRHGMGALDASHLYIECGDDCFQVVPAGSAIAPGYNAAVRYVTYANCVGHSIGAKLLICTDGGIALTAGDTDHSIRDVVFSDIKGSCIGRCIEIENHASRGKVGPVAVRDVYVRQSLGGVSPFSADASRMFDISGGSEAAVGGLDAVLLDNVNIYSPHLEAQITGKLDKVTIRGGYFDAPRAPDNGTIFIDDVPQGAIEIDGATIVSATGDNGIHAGKTGQVVWLEVRNTDIREIDSSTNGILLQACDKAIIANNRMTARSGATTTTGIRANLNNTVSVEASNNQLDGLTNGIVTFGSGGQLTSVTGLATFNVPIKPLSTAVASAPSGVAGQLMYVTDGDTGSPCLAVYDGSNWLRVALGTAIASS